MNPRQKSDRRYMRVSHLLEEEVELGVGVGVDGDLEEGREDVVQQLLKIVDQALRLVDVVQSRDLH